MKILITGAKGFVGRNLVETLKTIRDGKCKLYSLSSDIEIYEYDVINSRKDLKKYTKDCDFVFHLAGVNRPLKTEEYYEGNLGFTEQLCECLRIHNNQCPIMISSSIQVGKDNDYAKSKKEGEDLLISFGQSNGNPIYIYRFANLFGKWCKPNYNSVIATWCYNIANDLDIQVSNERDELSLCYIDDVVNELIYCLEGKATIDEIDGYYKVNPVYITTLGFIKKTIYAFKNSRENLNIINQGDVLIKQLYATYLSYLPSEKFSYLLNMNKDERGSFTEFFHTETQGQVSVNISKPGITKGNHWHHTKNEKFLVVAGTGVLQLRDIRNTNGKIIEYYVSADKLEVVDIPTGYTHNIKNLGDNDMVTIIWANEPFDVDKPDTYFEKVSDNHIK